MMSDTLTAAERAFWDRLTNVHAPERCSAQPVCPIHKPSTHHMRHWAMNWRNDRGILERICEHGIGHPDPDQRYWWGLTGQEHQGVHGCDGCCSVPYATLD